MAVMHRSAIDDARMRELRAKEARANVLRDELMRAAVLGDEALPAEKLEEYRGLCRSQASYHHIIETHRKAYETNQIRLAVRMCLEPLGPGQGTVEMFRRQSLLLGLLVLKAYDIKADPEVVGRFTPPQEDPRAGDSRPQSQSSE